MVVPHPILAYNETLSFKCRKFQTTFSLGTSTMTIRNHINGDGYLLKTVSQKHFAVLGALVFDIPLAPAEQQFNMQ